MIALEAKPHDQAIGPPGWRNPRSWLEWNDKRGKLRIMCGAYHLLDGKPLSYSVVQYDGQDPLIDAIKLNVEGRVLDENQKRQIAATLTRQHPKRKDDIYRAFELWMEPV